MTAVDGPEVGRLDRILAEQAAKVAMRDAMGIEVQQLRGMVVALEAECAALTDALDAMTHEFVTPGPVPDADMCGQPLLGSLGGAPRLLPCCEPADHPVHRTPARVRAELDVPS